MNLIKCYFTSSAWYQGTTKGSEPVGILWHDTAVTNNAGEHVGQVNVKRYAQPSADDPNYDELMDLLGKNTNNNHWNKSNSETGVNAFIGKLANGEIGTVQTAPFDYQAWGCGKASKGSLNGYTYDAKGNKTREYRHWIQFEICDDGYKDETYFKRVYLEAIEFTAAICKEYNIDPFGTVEYNGVQVPTILCHQDAHKLGFASDHSDVLVWFKKFGKTMADVRNDVNALLHPEEKHEEIHVGDLVSIAADAFYYSGKQVPNWVRAEKWYVLQVRDDKVIIDWNEAKNNSICSTINAKYLHVEKPADTEVIVESTPVDTPTFEAAPPEEIIEVIPTDPVVETEPTVEPAPATLETEDTGNILFELLKRFFAFIIGLFQKKDK